MNDMLILFVMWHEDMRFGRRLVIFFIHVFLVLIFSGDFSQSDDGFALSSRIPDRHGSNNYVVRVRLSRD